MVDSIPKIILITGAVTSGKTTLLSILAERLGSRCRVDGFLARSPERDHGSAQFAAGYVLDRLGKQESYPWATPRKNNVGYRFDPNTQHFLDHRFAQQIAASSPNLLFLDEFGKLELSGAGLETTLQSALTSGISLLVCTVKKRFLNEIVEKYDLHPSMCIDLDIMDSQRATEKIIHYVDFSCL